MPKVPPPQQKKNKKQSTMRLQLRLYIAGHAPNSLHALAVLTALCEEHFPSAHVLEIVDMLDEPQRALADGIIVTPTLLKLRPLPTQRIVGGLGDAPQMLRILAGK
jgi:circadian clock protein KaiB